MQLPATLCELQERQLFLLMTLSVTRTERTSSRDGISYMRYDMGRRCRARAAFFGLGVLERAVVALHRGFARAI